MNQFKINVFFITLLAGFPFANAEQASKSLEAHVHGLSELTVAMDAKSLEIQLVSPAMNLVGFEHKASSKKDIAAVNQAESLLRQYDSLFSIAGADCKHLSTSIDSDDLLVVENHHDDHDDHDKHEDHDDHDKHGDHDDHEKHEDHYDHEKYNDHDDHDKHDDHHAHDHHNENDHGESHSEMVASYSYSCNDNSKLSSIKVSLFESFPGIETINAMWVMLSNQGSVRLTAKNSTIELN
jgi:hypothetical protein